MICPECQNEIPSGAGFCHQCGTTLKKKCAQCGVDLLAGAKFCHECGTAANSPAADKPKPPETGLPAETATPPLETPLGERSFDLPDQEKLEREIAQAVAGDNGSHGERRQLTVIFSDLVSFTQLSEQLDPEDLNTVVHEYYAVCRAVCDQHEGHVANYLGDGVLIFFGYPAAHEDDAQRAARTGLAIIEGMAELNKRLDPALGAPLQVRVGIHTGLMIVDDDRGGNWQQMALGSTLNTAARIQSLADKNSVMVSSTTRQLIEGFFTCTSIGSHPLKGLSEPMELFAVTDESTARSRLEAMSQATMTPFTGRDTETAFLRRAWDSARAGMGCVVLVRGEAGVGKSRLVQTMKEQVANSTNAWMTPCQCSPYHQNTTMYPYIDLIERVVLKFERSEPPRNRLNKLEGMLIQYGFDIDESLPIFGAFHSIPPEAGYEPSPSDPAKQRRHYMDALLKILKKRSSRQPLLLVVEDLHWIDSTSLEVLKELADFIAEHSILALFTSRREFESPWDNHPSVKTLDLPRLGPMDTRSICLRVARGKKLPEDVVRQIIVRADGVPLFAEELTKMIIGSGLLEEGDEAYQLTGPLPELAIPTTLQDSLMARLDRLSTVKEIAQIAATIGRDFTFELVRYVHPLDEAVLSHSLTELVDAGLLVQTGSPPDASYMFTHALIQEAAYQSLVKSRRRHCHRLIAHSLEEHFPEVVDIEPEVLAHHYTKARMGRQAIPYLQKAGDISAARSAHKEAIVYYNKALELVGHLTGNDQSWQLEIGLLLGLGVSLTATRGYGAEEVEGTYSKARDLCEQVGSTGQHFQARYGLWRLNMLRANYGTATRQGEELLELATRQDNQAFLIAAHRALGATLFYRGQWEQSRQHLEEVIEVTSTADHGNDTLIRDIYDVVDPRVTCRSYLAWIFWMQGHPDRARLEANTAMDLANQLEHPFSQALALSFATWLEQFCGDAPRVMELSTAAIKLSREHEFHFWVGWGQVLKGWAGAQLDMSSDEAVEKINQGLEFWREKGSDLGRGYFLALLAETHMLEGHQQEAADALAQSQAFADENDERYWEAERHRLAGELARMRNAPHDEVEQHFMLAIETAREQGARSLELRAVASIAKHWQQQGRAADARQELAKVSDGFAEGQDTRDMLEAKSLLESLA